MRNLKHQEIIRSKRRALRIKQRMQQQSITNNIIARNRIRRLVAARATSTPVRVASRRARRAAGQKTTTRPITRTGCGCGKKILRNFFGM